MSTTSIMYRVDSESEVLSHDAKIAYSRMMDLYVVNSIRVLTYGDMGPMAGEVIRVDSTGTNVLQS